MTMKYTCIMNNGKDNRKEDSKAWVDTKRVEIEKEYWDKASKDKDVDKKYISNIAKDGFKDALGDLDGNVLEIGCGVGRLMKAGWYGIDISQGMIDIARSRKKNCHFEVSDGRTIPFEDNFFDHVYSVLVFQHIPFDAVLGYIKEAHRVLRKYGLFQFQFIEGNEDEPFSHHHDLDRILQALTDFGFFVNPSPQFIRKGIVHLDWTWVRAIKGGVR